MTKKTSKAGELCSYQVNELILENVKIACSMSLGAYSLNMMRLHSAVDEVSKNISYHLNTFVLGEKTKTESVTNRFRYPATWFQHLKYSYAPKWLLKKYPVKWKHESIRTEVKHYHCVPMFNEVLKPEYQKHTFRTMTFEPHYQSTFSDQ